jgi:hypothetical protein
MRLRPGTLSFVLGDPHPPHSSPTQRYARKGGGTGDRNVQSCRSLGLEARTGDPVNMATLRVVSRNTFAPRRLASCPWYQSPDSRWQVAGGRWQVPQSQVPSLPQRHPIFTNISSACSGPGGRMLIRTRVVAAIGHWRSIQLTVIVLDASAPRPVYSGDVLGPTK